jgi:nitrogen fixation protein FixH
MTRRFTGWHMAGIMILFFGVIVTVNMTMAVFATRTFGGKVVENSYVASQQFNEWLAAARAQEKLGWKRELSLGADRKIAVSVSATDAGVEGYARHPLGREAEVKLSFAPEGEGRFRSIETLPRGRWIVHLTVRRGGEAARYIETVQ